MAAISALKSGLSKASVGDALAGPPAANMATAFAAIFDNAAPNDSAGEVSDRGSMPRESGRTETDKNGRPDDGGEDADSLLAMTDNGLRDAVGTAPSITSADSADGADSTDNASLSSDSATEALPVLVASFQASAATLAPASIFSPKLPMSLAGERGEGASKVAPSPVAATQEGTDSDQLPTPLTSAKTASRKLRPEDISIGAGVTVVGMPSTQIDVVAPALPTSGQGAGASSRLASSLQSVEEARAALASDATTAPASDGAQEALDPALLTSVAGSVGTAAPPSSKPEIAQPPILVEAGCAPIASTADILSARGGRTMARRSDAFGRTDAGGVRKDADEDGTPDVAPVLAPAGAPAIVLGMAVPQGGAAMQGTIGGGVTAGEMLTGAVADRQLDLVKQSAWLDGLARDIAASADPGGKVSFQLNPEKLGPLHVTLTRDETGTALTLTAANPAVQSLLSDAKPQLLSEARAHGLHLSDARIDLAGASGATMGGQNDQARSQDKPDNGRNNPQAHQARGEQSGSPGGAGTGAGGGQQARQQTVLQPEIAIRSGANAPAAVSETSPAAVNASETDARYA